MGDVIGLVLMGAGSILIWIGLHVKEGKLSDMLGEFFGAVNPKGEFHERNGS